MKNILTKETILRPYKEDLKSLRIFQIIGATITAVLLFLFIIGFIRSEKTRWEYVGVATFIFALFVVLPLFLSKKARNRIREINNTDFYISKAVITHKDADAKKDKESGDYKWEYYVEAAGIGKLPKMSKLDWDACEEGDEVYIVMDITSVPMMSFPLSMYTLSEDLNHLLRPLPLKKTS